MTAPVSYRRAERFAQLVDESAGARRHRARSAADDALAPLVAVSHRLRQVRPRVGLDPRFRGELRAMLVATAERDGIGATATQREPASRLRQPLAGAGRPAAAPAGRRRIRVRTRATVIVGLVAGTLALSGMSTASGDAMPGDALYGVKRSTERAQLALAGSDVNRGQLYLEFARTRVNEAHAVRQDQAALTAILDDMDAETRQGVKLLTTVAVNVRDPAALDVVNGFVEPQRRKVAALLDHPVAATRQRVRESLELLDRVSRRTAGLRTAWGCTGGAGGDSLGPLPSTCGTAGQRVGPVPGPDKSRATRSGPADEPEPDGRPGTDGSVAGPPPGAGVNLPPEADANRRRGG